MAFTDLNELHSIVSWKNRKDKRGVFEPRAVVMRGAKPAGIFTKKKSINAGFHINSTPIKNVSSSGKLIPKDISLNFK